MVVVALIEAEWHLITRRKRRKVRTRRNASVSELPSLSSSLPPQ